MPEARHFWDAFPRSTRRAILDWISSAKSPETRDSHLEPWRQFNRMVKASGDVGDVAAGTPHLTTLVNNAGIQRLLDFTAAEPTGPGEIAINFAGLINVTAAALSLLRRAPLSRMFHVGSGLGFVAYATAPVYQLPNPSHHANPRKVTTLFDHTNAPDDFPGAPASSSRSPA